MVRIGVTELLLFAMLIVMYLDASLLHPNFFRPSTFFYSCMFVFTFLLYRSIVIRGAISVNDVARFVRYVLYAYFVVLVLQQFQVLIGEQPWNAPVYTENRWKLNSLSMEPSTWAVGCSNHSGMPRCSQFFMRMTMGWLHTLRRNVLMAFALQLAQQAASGLWHALP